MASRSTHVDLDAVAAVYRGSTIYESGCIVKPWWSSAAKPVATIWCALSTCSACNLPYSGAMDGSTGRDRSSSDTGVVVALPITKFDSAYAVHSSPHVQVRQQASD